MQNPAFHPAPPAAKPRRKKRLRLRWGRIAMAALCLCLAVGLAVELGRLAVNAAAGLHAAADYGAASYDLSGYTFNAADPTLVLVNNNLPLSDGYAPETALADDATGKSLATDAAAAYRQMAAAAAADGVSLVLCSGYRDYDYQAGLFQKRVQTYLDEGKTAEEAAALAQTIVAKPGCSEHQTGLAADIVTADYTALDAGFAKTDAYAWLCRYAPDYGFLLRYPESRQADTGIVYEPWHWRYVGTANAQAITASGLSLEGFLALHTAAADQAASSASAVSAAGSAAAASPAA
jgi:D-alanyl-D-alanine carboxypeptidase